MGDNWRRDVTALLVMTMICVLIMLTLQLLGWAMRDEGFVVVGWSLVVTSFAFAFLAGMVGGEAAITFWENQYDNER